MSKILQKEIRKLETLVSTVSTKVEENLNLSIKSLMDNDAKLAKKAVMNDTEIDSLEIEVEEECLKILALHQPVAIDLRYIISVLKINNDLERIGDLGANIAEVSILLSEKRQIAIPGQIPKMTKTVLKMLKNCLDALFEKDVEIAKLVQESDDIVDNYHSEMYEIVQKAFKENSNDIEQLFSILSVSRYLERIADHCTNISEDVEYLIEGRITRHNL